jgi:hypothetical protein
MLNRRICSDHIGESQEFDLNAQDKPDTPGLNTFWRFSRLSSRIRARELDSYRRIHIGDLLTAHEMKTSYVLLIIGVLALLAGIGMYVSKWHRSIGLGGTALGVLLLVVGGYMAAREKKPAAMQPKLADQTK